MITFEENAELNPEEIKNQRNKLSLSDLISISLSEEIGFLTTPLETELTKRMEANLGTNISAKRIQFMGTAGTSLAETHKTLMQISDKTEGINVYVTPEFLNELESEMVTKAWTNYVEEVEPRLVEGLPLIDGGLLKRQDALTKIEGLQFPYKRIYCTLFETSCRYPDGNKTCQDCYYEEYPNQVPPELD